jgi:hypothetical protein
MDFYAQVLQESIDTMVIDRDDAIVVLGGGSYDAQKLAAARIQKCHSDEC